ncbi:MAG: aldo/keto reductase, partial [Bacteroidota bacterium]
RSDLKNKVQITTKCGIRLVCDNRPEHKIKSYDASRKHILQSAENSLRYLGVDCLDLLLIHRPDYLMNPHEIAEAFETLRSSGKVKTFGVSNFTPSQFDLLNSFTPLATNQIEVSLFQRSAFEDGTLDQCIRHNISPTAWSPYGGGAIFASETAPEYQAIKKVLEELGETYGASADQLLLAFLCKHPAGIIPILGSSKIHRIESAKAALDIHLSHEDWYRLWEAALGEEVA